MIAQSFRYWLANIISGGELVRAQRMEKYTNASVEFARYQAHEAADKARNLQCALNYWQREANEGWGTATHRLLALQEIAAMETPAASWAWYKANATVRRMARTAREAVK